MLALAALFLFYNLNLRPIPSGDSLPTVLGAESLWLDGTFSVDRFADFIPPFAGYFHEENGHLVGNYPRMQVVVASPFYAPLRLIPGVRSWPPEKLVVAGRIIEKIAASTLAVLCVWLFFRIAALHMEARYALGLALVLGAATPNASSAAQALWSQTLAMPFLLAATYAGLRSRTASRALLWVLSSAFLGGVAYMVRPTTGLFFASMGLVLLLVRRDWRQVAAFAAVGFAMIYLNATGNPGMQGTGSVEATVHTFRGDLLAGVYGVLLSPARGLFIYAPVLLLAVMGVWLALRDRELRRGGALAELMVLSVLYVGALTITIAKWNGWQGGYCFGPRLLLSAIPFALLATIPAWPRIVKGHSLRVLAGLLISFGIFVQYVGVYHYPRGHWDSLPEPAEFHPERYFDWSDNPISRSFLAGPSTESYRILFAYLRGGPEGAKRVMETNGVRIY